MRRALTVVAGVLVALVVATPGARSADEEKIKEAVARGVDYLKRSQQANGSWQYQESGMTSLAALTLLECGVAADDPAIQKAAAYIREKCVAEDKTYSLALAIMFLDRLGEGVDVALIEAMATRLLSGQQVNGGWTYRSGSEIIVGQQPRLKEAVMRRAEGDGKGERRAPKVDERRAPSDIAPATKGEIDAILKRGPIIADRPADSRNQTILRSDNSNTQFAVLALWIARRYGIPVDGALGLVEKRFHGSQNADGGWGYWALGWEKPGAAPMFNPSAASTSAMTCVGLIGLAMYHAAAGESALRAGPKGGDSDGKKGGGAKPARDITNDQAVDRGLKYLAGALAAPLVQGRDGGALPGVRPGDNGQPGSGGFQPPQVGRPGGGAGQGPPQGGRPQGFPPRGKPPEGFQPPGAPPQGGRPGGGFRPGQGGMDHDMMPGLNKFQAGKAYYFLWSLERAAVAYSLDRIGGKDWYNWGADILLANQDADGGWQGAHGYYGADTCFALLFLRRADLAKDLSVSLRGKIKDVVELRGGGVGFRGRESIKPVRSPFEDPASGGEATAAKPPAVKAKPPTPAAPATTVEPDVAKLSAELVDAPPSKWSGVLNKLRDGKGPTYTQALANAVPQLDGDLKKKARQALAERLSSLTANSVAAYMEDDDPELRRAAALACAMKEDMAHVGKLIALLGDPERTVERAAYAALKDLTKQDFGPAADANEAAKADAIKAWKAWWKKQAEK